MADVEQEIDHLYTLPLAEFTPARNSLAASLKRSGNAKDSERVKSLAKPSASAWAVNQLFWKHRNDFDRLMKAGEEFRQAQAAQIAGKSSDARKAGEARQDAIAALSRIASELLRESGHTASPDAMRRIATTLEALSAYVSVPGTPSPGRLTEDVEAPGFDALTALFAGRVPQRETTHAEVVRAVHHTTDTKTAPEFSAAKAALREAQQALNQAEAKAQSLELQVKKAAEDLEQAEKRRDEAQRRFSEVSRDAKEAERAVTKARREVEWAERKL